jgi:hypothetical protein
MTTCVQILEGSSLPDDFEVWKLLDYSSVLGSPLPRRTKSREGVLNRPKGTKRDRPDAAAGGEGAYRHLSTQASMHELGWFGDSGNHETSVLQSDPSGRTEGKLWVRSSLSLQRESQFQSQKRRTGKARKVWTKQQEAQTKKSDGY